MKTLSKILLATLVAGVLASFGILGWGFYRAAQTQQQADQTAAEVKLEAAPVRVIALGLIEPRDGIIVIAGPSGSTGSRVAALRVAEGDVLRRDQIIATLDNEPGAAALVLQAKTTADSRQLEYDRAVLSAIKIVATLRASVDQNTAERDRAATELAKQRSLVESGLYKRASLRDKELALASAEQKLKSAEFELTYAKELSQSGEGFDVASARIALESAKAALLKAEEDHALTIIKSPGNGVVLSLQAHAGEQLGSDGLLKLADTTSLEVRAEVFEADVNKISVRQRVTIESRLISPALRGSVRWISPAVEKQSLLSDDPTANTDNRVVTVRIKLNADAVEQASRLINHQVRASFDLSEAEPLIGAISSAN